MVPTPFRLGRRVGLSRTRKHETGISRNRNELDAGKAYERLWGLLFLERDAGQLIAKRVQILNAPAAMRVMAKGKSEVIDRFTQLLKDTVKLQHKVFTSSSYATEVRRLQQFCIPECFDKRGTKLIDSTTALADASMAMTEEGVSVIRKDNTPNNISQSDQSIPHPACQCQLVYCRTWPKSERKSSVTSISGLG